jgi:hypothetical protein
MDYGWKHSIRTGVRVSPDPFEHLNLDLSSFLDHAGG